MKKTLTLAAVLFLMGLNAQGPPAGGNKDMAKAMKDIKGRVYGKLLDARKKKPVEYATILVLWYNKDSLVGGAISNDNGDFTVENLPPMGGFRFRVKRVG